MCNITEPRSCSGVDGLCRGDRRNAPTGYAGLGGEQGCVGGDQWGAPAVSRHPHAAHQEDASTRPMPRFEYTFTCLMCFYVYVRV